jgi:hypothetical protein
MLPSIIPARLVARQHSHPLCLPIQRHPPPAIYRKAWTGTGVEELIFQSSLQAPINLSDISYDGKFLTYSSGGVNLPASVKPRVAGQQQ